MQFSSDVEVSNPKTYWESVARTKEFTTPFQANIFKKHVKKDAYILDVGCGYGRTLNELYDNGYKNSTGADFSEKMLERGRAAYPHLRFETMKQSEIKYPENTFDAVILLALLTCIIRDDEQIKLLNEVKRVLKPDAVIYINDFLLNSDERNVTRYKEYERKYKTYGVFELPQEVTLRHHSKEWVKDSLQIFKELEFEEMEYTTMNNNKSNGYYYFGKKQ
ncbi:MAG: class I SAM-dependent methyltransferase [Chitinispirillales bacterium]|nr:class I SAM-dependent methyltransferase [Chitinispirillales bacterium]